MARNRSRPSGPFWHGSFGEITGDKIVPRSKLEDHLRNVPATPIGGDVRRVYFTNSLNYARAWVWRSPNSVVYRVTPFGGIDPDPDTPGIGFSTNQILRVDECIESPVSMTADEARRAFASADLSRFHEDGSVRLSHPEMAWRRDQGLTQEDLDNLDLPAFCCTNRILYNTITESFEYVRDDFQYTAATAMYGLIHEMNLSADEAERVVDENAASIEEDLRLRPPGWV